MIRFPTEAVGLRYERAPDTSRSSDEPLLEAAMAQHVKTVFVTLKPHEQQALKVVIRRLVALGRGEEGHLIRRTVPYRDLVSSPELDQRAGAKGLVDRLIKEGVLSAD